MPKYTYKINESGYTIFQDGDVSITQYEPYIPYKELGYEGSAKKQIEELEISDYADKLYRKEITEADIPAEYLERVKTIVDERVKQDSEYSQAQYDAVIAELVTEGRL